LPDTIGRGSAQRVLAQDLTLTVDGKTTMKTLGKMKSEMGMPRTLTARRRRPWRHSRRRWACGVGVMLEGREDLH